MQDLADGLYRFGVALAIGAFVGLERQARLESDEAEQQEPTAAEAEEQLRAAVAAGEASRVRSAEPVPTAAPAAPGDLPVPDFQQAAGLRTYSLIGLSGAMAAAYPSPLVFVAGFTVLGLLIGASYVASQRRQGDLGLTSEIAALAVFLLGGMCVDGQVILPAALGVGVAFLLSLKRRLHRFARRIQEEDIHAVIKFAALTVVILPLLPQQPVRLGDLLPASGAAAVAPVEPAATAPGSQRAAAGPALAAPAPAGAAPAGAAPAPTLRPQPADTLAWWRGLSIDLRKVWLLVILISALSFAGYILGQWVGTNRGLILTGVVGGIASSTAVTLTYAQRSRQAPELAPQLATGILLANAIMPVRILVLVGVLETSLFLPLAAPLLLTAAVGGLAALVLYLRGRDGSGEGGVRFRNPFQIGTALKFGLLFGVVVFAAQVAQRLFGEAGLYAVGGITGLTSVDPIGLTMAQMVGEGAQSAAVGAVAVALAVISNTLVKGGFVVVLGDPRLRRVGAVCFGLMVAATCAGIALLQAAGRLPG